MKKVYIVRHGDIGLGKNKRYIGIKDLPLSAEGRKQAFSLKERLREIPLDRIYCSALSRSRETAAIIAEAHPLSLTVLPDLHEIEMGEWEGRLFSEIQELFPAEYRQRGEDIVNYRPPGGESFLHCYLRIIPVFERIVRSDAETSLIVGHAGVNRVILCHALGLPLPDIFSFKQNYGCLTLLSQNHRGQWEGKLNILAVTNG
ncbi:alpha-ribazole phosphatase [Desulfitobacterium dehalogenans ATCC 51507]|uniref:Alpha-ribazole phosphatase n=1 Tax=Desulfitobacterium dehalogenans (strain ATCC 51507 / DSM 9161 / JW/IU-DC1) TaxID=756499 RepID=I4AAD9_DESDJ|nr:alpha-ribazole phosphatase [Desulfitobacterium dehalogenans]AFM00924.1 alpha-ribazole phosphatase [Desulfitobacterium dehalogenans ATCC 51507]